MRFRGNGRFVAGLQGFVGFGGAGRGAEEARNFVGALGNERNVVADLDAGEEVFNVFIAEADAAVGRVFADRVGAIGAVDAEAFDAQTDPAGAEGILRAGTDDDAGLVVRGIFQALHDLVFAGGAGADGSADGHVINSDDAITFKQGEFAVRVADDDTAGWMRRGFRCGGWGILRGSSICAEGESGEEDVGKGGPFRFESDFVGWPVHGSFSLLAYVGDMAHVGPVLAY